jgi:hypothetical protein
MKLTTLAAALLCLVTTTSLVQGQDYNLHGGNFDMTESIENFGDASTRELFAEDRSGPSSPSSDGGCPSISPVSPKSFKLNNKAERHYLVRLTFRHTCNDMRCDDVMRFVSMRFGSMIQFS